MLNFFTDKADPQNDSPSRSMKHCVNRCHLGSSCHCLAKVDVDVSLKIKDLQEILNLFPNCSQQ